MHVRRSMSIPRRMASEPFPEPEFLEHHLSHVPPPACWIQLDLRGGLREEVAPPHPGVATSNLDEAFAGSVEGGAISFTRDGMHDVLHDDLRLGMRKYTCLR